MNTEGGKSFIRQLADFRVPVLIFSGGEPLLREDIFELASFARDRGIGVVLSSNGTLITEEAAANICDIGFKEVGISIDGIGQTNDFFRGKKGAYQQALQGIRRCVASGQRVSLRFTITRYNYKEISAIFDLTESEDINRVCFYHLAYSGRGMRGDDLNHSETRAAIDLICECVLDLHRDGLQKEVLTVGNYADGIYIYLKLKEQDPERAEKILSLLRKQRGDKSGISIGAVDELGNVYPDQFWRSHSLGNVQRRNFGDIWMDISNPLMHGLKDRKRLLKGRCARCKYIDLCNGNLRVRAEAVFNDIWAEDPACYLTEEEIGGQSS
jgi:radical SAM protein with 4Fe4S-binding SPASM domain